MLAKIVGQVDGNSGLVLVVICICICVVVTSLIVKRRSRLVIDNEFQLEKIKLADAQTQAMANIALQRDFKLKQLDQNLITSHVRTDDR